MKKKNNDNRNNGVDLFCVTLTIWTLKKNNNNKEKKKKKKINRRMSIPEKVTIVLISTNEDFILCQNYCRHCLETKLNVIVLRTFEIEADFMLQWEPIRKVKIKKCMCK